MGQENFWHRLTSIIVVEVARKAVLDAISTDSLRTNLSCEMKLPGTSLIFSDEKVARRLSLAV